MLINISKIYFWTITLSKGMTIQHFSSFRIGGKVVVLLKGKSPGGRVMQLHINLSLHCAIDIIQHFSMMIIMDDLESGTTLGLCLASTCICDIAPALDNTLSII